MKTILNNISNSRSNFFIFILLIFLTLPTLSSATDEVSADEEYIIDLINTIRQDPLTYAETLGFNRTELKNSLPWLKDGNLQLSPLKTEDFLFLDAAHNNQTDETIDSDFQVSAEHDYMVTAETGGILSFNSFIAPRDAIRVVVENLFKNELDPNRSDPLYICSSDYDVAGAAFRTGVLDASSQRAYFITVSFAATSVLKTQIQLLTVINQIRANPFTFQKYLTDISDSTIVDFFNSFFMLVQTYEPLFYNPILSQSATGVLNAEKNEGLSNFEYAQTLGYNGIDTKQVRVNSSYAATHTPYPASVMVSSILIKDSSRLNRRLLNADLNELGLGLSFSAWTTDSPDDATAKTVLHFGQTDDPSEGQPEAQLGVGPPGAQTADLPVVMSKIYGIVFLDKDDNSVYTPGEEIESKEVSIYDVQGQLVKKVVSDAAGRWTAELVSGDYTIEAMRGNNLKRIILSLDRNTFVPLDLYSIDN